MELRLEVVLSSSIKRKKPWPRFCWLGQEKEAVFLLDDQRISEINMVTGRTKKKTPKLHPLLNSVVTMAASQTGVWLAGVLVSGELFLWNRDRDCLKTASAVPEVAQLLSTLKGNASRVSLQVSGDGMRVVLAVITGHVYLWECTDVRDLSGGRDGPVGGRWAHIRPSDQTALPTLTDKEASQHGIFVQNEAVGDVFLSALVFTSGDKLTVTFLEVQWEEALARDAGCVGYSVKWASKTFPLARLTPPCTPVRSRGALVPALAPDGRLLAVAVNQKDPRATQVLFISTQNFVSIARGLGGCGSKNLTIPPKYRRSYWVGGVSWSPSGLFLACVLKRGSLLTLARLGGLLSLSTSGCNVDFGPAHFLPLHPLVTYRPPASSVGRGGDASLSSSGVSLRDVLRQRFSVTWHPRLAYLIVSDGYMASVLRLADAAGRAPAAPLLTALLREAREEMESTVLRLEKTTQVNIRLWLDFVSGLSGQKEEMMDPLAPSVGPSTRSPEAPSATGPALPPFLQDQGTLGDTMELLHKAQALFEDDSDVDVRAAGSHAQDGGVLEFASMFDTLHARPDPHPGPDGVLGAPEDDGDQKTTFFSAADSSAKKKKKKKNASLSLRTLGKVRGHVLGAWALGLSLGEPAEEYQALLVHTVHCVLRLAALLYYTASTAAAGKKNVSLGDGGSRVSQLFSAFLVFLSWDAVHCGRRSSCLASVVELTQRLAQLLLSPLPTGPLPLPRSPQNLTSQSIAAALRVVRQAADSLDHTYTLQQRHVWAAPAANPAPQGSTQEDKPSLLLWSSDVYRVPLLQDLRAGRSRQSLLAPQQPSSRLVGVWRWLYSFTLRYMEDLRAVAGLEEEQEQEQEQTTLILFQIQEALQGMGARLDDGPAPLLSCPGERRFLVGSYSESAEAWRAEMWAERNISGGGQCSGVFQETRVCLAVLYGLLSQYRLREAQALGDHMVRLVLGAAAAAAAAAAPRQQGAAEPTEAEVQAAAPGSWLPADLHEDAARAVVQALGRFMASYFTNRPLGVPPPHAVEELLPPLHLPDGETPALSSTSTLGLPLYPRPPLSTST